MRKFYYVKAYMGIQLLSSKKPNKDSLMEVDLLLLTTNLAIITFSHQLSY